MKHLKSYSLYECPPDYKPWENGQFVLTVKIERKIGYYFSLKDIYSCVKRMCDYMKIEGFFSSVFVDRARFGITSISLPEDERSLSTNLDADNDYTSCTLKFSYRSKSINESKSDEMREDIKDICLEIEDIGFECKINKSFLLITKPSGNKTPVTMRNKSFYYKEVNEVCSRIREYLGNQFSSIRTYYDDDWQKVEVDLPILGVMINYNLSI